jgi:hypothetical protein
MDRARTSIEWEGKSIIIEGPVDFVAEQTDLFRRANSKMLDLGDERVAKHTSTAAALIAEKKPRGHGETIAVLAAFLAIQGVEVFTEEEIKRTYIQARIRPPKVMAQALRDAKNKYDFVESAKKRGSYCLSVHGRRTVEFDLPRPIA